MLVGEVLLEERGQAACRPRPASGRRSRGRTASASAAATAFEVVQRFSTRISPRRLRSSGCSSSAWSTCSCVAAPSRTSSSPSRSAGDWLGMEAASMPSLSARDGRKLHPGVADRLQLAGRIRAVRGVLALALVALSAACAAGATASPRAEAGHHRQRQRLLLATGLLLSRSRPAARQGAARAPELGRQARCRDAPSCRRRRSERPGVRLAPLRRDRPRRGRENVQVLFTIFGSPAWANGGQLPTRAPHRAGDLMDFSFAAAQRYGGEFMRDDGIVLPRVRYWTAWNEPNLTIGLVPQWKRVGKHWVIQSAIDYARICNAVVDGVRGTLIPGREDRLRRHGPRGNNAPDERTSDDLADRVSPCDEARGRDRLRRLRSPPVSERPVRDADDAPGRPDGGHLRQPRHARRRGDEALRPQGDLARRVRLPDEPARRRSRRHACEAGALPDAVGRARAQATLA